jgi:DNA helicase IV
MTLVGDLGQASSPAAALDWSAITASLGADRVSIVELDVNYRTPAEVMEVATPVGRAWRPNVRPPRSVRRSGAAPEEIGADNLARTVTHLIATLGVERGRAAVVVPPSWGATDDGDDALDRSVAVLPPDRVKGLEFDHVVVVDPRRIADECGLGALYVALTRPTQQLTLVFDGPAGPLP